MSERGDTELMLAAGRGDRDAYAALIERHHRSIVQFVLRFLGTMELDVTEDLAQEVFLRAWKAAPSFKPRAKVMTWLLRLTTNTCLNYRRSSRLRKTVSLDGDGLAVQALEQSGPPDLRAMADEEAERVRAAVGKLPPNQQAAVVLRHFHELSYSDIAQVLGISVSAVESVLFRARETLRRLLKVTEGETTPQVFPKEGAK